MAERPTDVLITDMRMPGMDGDELLAAVRDRYPHTVRMVLTGQCGKGAVIRLIPLAHRILTKPFDADRLRNILTRTRSLRNLLSNPALIAVIGHLGGLPAVSAVHARVLAELDDPDVSLSDVAEIVAEDVGLVTKLMHMANSALFGLRQPVTSPMKAVQVLGVEMTRATVLATRVLDRYDPRKLLPYSIENLWPHSIRTAKVAGMISQREGGGERSSDAALAGLLHDVGRLILADRRADDYREVLRLTTTEGLSVVHAEFRVFGATHAEVGAYLLGLWGLPESVVEAVAWHHSPSHCPAAAFTSLTAVHVAEAVLGAEECAALDRDYLDRIKVGDRIETWTTLAAETGSAT
jgi:putative nucleotidyltransferase with HDIG domain